MYLLWPVLLSQLSLLTIPMFGLTNFILCFGFIFHGYFSLILPHQQQKIIIFQSHKTMTLSGSKSGNSWSQAQVQPPQARVPSARLCCLLKIEDKRRSLSSLRLLPYNVSFHVNSNNHFINDVVSESARRYFCYLPRYQDDLRRSQPCQSRPVWKEDERSVPPPL